MDLVNPRGVSLDLIPSRDGLELFIAQPKPIDLRAVFVGNLAMLDPRSRKICQWVRGRLHAGTEGTFLEFWDRTEDDGLGERHVVYPGQVIVGWPDSTWQVLSPDEFQDLCLVVGTEMWSRDE